MQVFLKNLLPTLEIFITSLVVAYIGQLLDKQIGLSNFSSSVVIIGGAILLLLGILIRIWATVAFSRSRVKVLQLSAPETLVQNGPYAYSRNPLYVGIFLMVSGVAVIFGSISMAVFSVALLIFADWWIKNKEEPSLLKKFGEPYRHYLRTTRRWM